MDGNRGESKRNAGSDQTQQQKQQPISTSDEDIKDAPASEFTTPSSQFSDLHNRLQVMHHAMNNIFKEISHLSRASEERHYELAKRETVSPSQITALENRLASIERAVELVRRDIEGKDYKGQLDKLQDALRDTHTSLTDVMPHIFDEFVSTSAPRMGFFAFVFIMFQLSLVGLYIWYKRRRAHAPKKYL
jgi:mannose-binding lectin 1